MSMGDDKFLFFFKSLFRSAVVQLGFEALQLVVADFLALIPLVCLTTCLEVASKFGVQTQDLNISLTSVGLLVSVRYYNVPVYLIILASHHCYSNDSLDTIITNYIRRHARYLLLY